MGSATTNFYSQAYSRRGWSEVAAAVRAALAGGRPGRAAALVTDDMVLATTLIGTEDMVRAPLAVWRDAGVDTVRLYPAGDTLDARLATPRAGPSSSRGRWTRRLTCGPRRQRGAASRSAARCAAGRRSVGCGWPDHHAVSPSIRRSRMPSRIAHGEMVSSRMPISFIAVWPTSAPPATGPRARRDARRLGAARGGRRGQLRDRAAESPARQLPAHEGTVPAGRRAAQPGELGERARGGGRRERPSQRIRAATSLSWCRT